MEPIIITVCDTQTGYRQDLEIPTGVPAGQLVDDITQTLTGYEPSLRWIISQTALYSPRLNLKLPENQTAEQLGLRTGDYLYIVNK